MNMISRELAFPAVSIVIPVFNEQNNITPLIQRLKLTCEASSLLYEVIIIDDKSVDNTWSEIVSLIKSYPIRAYKKSGERGKAQSLLEGFAHVKSPIIAMIDGDLQYPPEAIPEMVKQIIFNNVDVVVANRKTSQGSKIRRFVSTTYRLMFGKILWRLDLDVQSGLKVFKTEIIKRMDLHPQPWTFDLEFLVKSKNAGYKIGEYDIDFLERYSGVPKVRIIATSYQIGKETLKLVFKDSRRIPLGSSDSLNGFHYKGNAYEPHNHINFLETAVQRFSIRQTLILLSLLFIVVLGFIADWHRSLVSIISFLTVVYFLDLMLNLLLVSRSYFSFKPELVSHAEMKAINDWPSYTVLCPLYKETAVLPQFVNAMSAINYPHDKLEILLLLEQDDINTIATAKRMKLPAYFKIVIVPDSMPKTKPKACNYGLKIATGEYIVIYDAEDIPATNQLKKAVITFNRSTEKVGCVQAKLNYYNWNQNVLTRLFTMEYSLWFELILPGLQSIHAPIPLGGTSNHFRTANLRKLGGWDPFNVTEDADLGIRLSKNGFSTLVLDSITMEEANSQYKNWVRQRSRWIKGYIQTYFVHTRKLEKKQSTRNLIIFQFIIGGKVLSSLINPLLWGLTVFYFIFPGEIGHFIHSLYSPAIFYLALITLVVGNFLYMYYYMMGVVKRNHSELVMVAPLVPFYWLLISVATFKAIYEFIVKPFYWQKTQHGLHLVGLNHIRDDQQPILELEIDSSGNVG